jgi:hypothetical protein
LVVVAVEEAVVAAVEWRSDHRTEEGAVEVGFLLPWVGV